MNESAAPVRTLSRGLAVLKAMSGHAQLTVADLSERTGLARAVVRRASSELVADGLMVKVDDRYFAPSAKLLDLGYDHFRGLHVSDVIQPHLRSLADHTGHSSSAAVLDGNDVRYIARAETHRMLRLSLRVGSRLAASETSMGHVLLAFHPADAMLGPPDELQAELAAVRSQGWAMAGHLLDPELRSLAVPIKGRDGTVVAAMNLAVLNSPLGDEELRNAYLPALQRHGYHAEQDLTAAWFLIDTGGDL